MPPKKGTEAYNKWKDSDGYKLFINGRTGENHPNYGKPRSEETKQKISISNTNPSKETRQKISNSAKERFKDKRNHPMFGKKNLALAERNRTEIWTEERRRKASERRKGKKNLFLAEWNRQHSGENNHMKEKARNGGCSGEKNHNWKDGISFEPYTKEFNKQLKKLIRMRDNFICQNCNKTEAEEGKRLCIHHIDYVKENCLPTNLITLCCKCNSKVNSNRKKWTKYFQEKMILGDDK